MAKSYPAKKAPSRRKAALPRTLAAEVRRGSGGFTASALAKSASGHSPSWAVRKLAELLGYPPSTDFHYLRTDEAGLHHFQIVQVEP